MRREVLGIEPNTLSMLGRNSTSKIYSQTLHFSKFLFSLHPSLIFYQVVCLLLTDFCGLFIGINIKSSNTFFCHITDLQPCLQAGFIVYSHHCKPSLLGSDLLVLLRNCSPFLTLSVQMLHYPNTLVYLIFSTVSFISCI